MSSNHTCARAVAAILATHAGAAFAAAPADDMDTATGGVSEVVVTRSGAVRTYKTFQLPFRRSSARPWGNST